MEVSTANFLFALKLWNKLKLVLSIFMGNLFVDYEVFDVLI